MPTPKNTCCATGVCQPERTQGLKAPAPASTHQLVRIAGPGVFLGAAITKQGGASGLTVVILDLDGRNVTNLSYAAAENAGLTQQNPYGLVLLKSNSLKTLTVGFPAPLRFESDLKLSVTVNEPGVVQILANVIHVPFNRRAHATRFSAALLAALTTCLAADPAPVGAWKIGTPIVTYWAGPPMTDAAATQMAEGGWNLVWCSNEQELDIAHRHGLRGLLTDGLLAPASLDDPKRREKLDALIARRAQASRALRLPPHRRAERRAVSRARAAGRLSARARPGAPGLHQPFPHLRQQRAARQPGRRGHGLPGASPPLRGQVKPALISYDHYQFALKGDNDQYFLNLALIRRRRRTPGCRS